MIDVPSSPELKAAILGFRQAERDIRLDINKTARTELKPVWTEALRGHVNTRLEDRVMTPGARIAVGQRQITAHAATSRRPLRGGLIPTTQWHSVEYGNGRYKQFRPRSKNGYVAGPAAAIVIRRAVGLWVNTIVDKFRAHAEVK